MRNPTAALRRRRLAAGLVLPLVLALAAADDPGRAEKAPRPRQDRAELQRLEAELAAKRAEVRALEAKVEAARLLADPAKLAADLERARERLAWSEMMSRRYPSSMDRQLEFDRQRLRELELMHAAAEGKVDPEAAIRQVEASRLNSEIEAARDRVEGSEHLVLKGLRSRGQLAADRERLQELEERGKAAARDAEADLKKARDRLAWSERMAGLGYLSKRQVEAERRNLKRLEGLGKAIELQAHSIGARP